MRNVPRHLRMVFAPAMQRQGVAVIIEPCHAETLWRGSFHYQKAKEATHMDEDEREEIRDDEEEVAE